MKRVVLDSGVCMKWLLGKNQKTRTHKIAANLFNGVRRKELSLLEPPIWRAEIVAKMSRISPIRIDALIKRLTTIEARTDNSEECLRKAADLSIQLDHDLFDTLYHAVALNHSIDLITANVRYYRKACGLGNIILLRNWPAALRIAERRAKYVLRKRKRKRRPPARLRKKR